MKKQIMMLVLFSGIWVGGVGDANAADHTDPGGEEKSKNPPAEKHENLDRFASERPYYEGNTSRRSDEEPKIRMPLILKCKNQKTP